MHQNRYWRTDAGFRLDTGVLVQSGKYRAEAVAAADGTPDRTVPSFAEVPGLLGLGPTSIAGARPGN